MTGDTDIVYRELNTRWLRLFATVTPFTGQACSFTHLMQQRDACLRARSILEAYDRFEIAFPETVPLKRIIQSLRKEIPLFLDRLPNNLSRMTYKYWRRFCAVCHRFVHVNRGLHQQPKGFWTACCFKLDLYCIEYQRIYNFGLLHGIKLPDRREAMRAALQLLHSAASARQTGDCDFEGGSLTRGT